MAQVSKTVSNGPPIAVLAGNYGQFVVWCRENRMVPGREARYIYSRETSMGIEFEEFVRVGTWWTASNQARETFRQLGLTHRIENGIRVSKHV